MLYWNSDALPSSGLSPGGALLARGRAPLWRSKLRTVCHPADADAYRWNLSSVRVGTDQDRDLCVGDRIRSLGGGARRCLTGTAGANVFSLPRIARCEAGAILRGSTSRYVPRQRHSPLSGPISPGRPTPAPQGPDRYPGLASVPAREQASPIYQLGTAAPAP